MMSWPCLLYNVSSEVDRLTFSPYVLVDDSVQPNVVFASCPRGRIVFFFLERGLREHLPSSLHDDEMKSTYAS
jgi:hypothetical protein